MFLASKRVAGFTLIELMLVVTLSSLLLVAIYQFYGYFQSSNRYDMHRLELHSQLQSYMNEMTREIRRSSMQVYVDNTFVWNTALPLKISSFQGGKIVSTPGTPNLFPEVNASEAGPILAAKSAYGNGRLQLVEYTGGVSAKADILVPFTLPPNGVIPAGDWYVLEPTVLRFGSGLRVFNYGGKTNSCILFSYKVHTIIPGNNAEEILQRGYRLSTIDGVGVLQVRSGGVNFDDCSDGTWVNLSESKQMNVTALGFVASPYTIVSRAGRTFRRYQVAISIKAKLIKQSEVVQTIKRTVFVRNGQFDE